MNHDIEKALDNLEKRAQDIQHYMNIMSKVKTVNVADDQDFQREFDFFYKVRRNAEWRKVFFEIFERKKKKNCSYKEIITELYEGTGQVEASFASKMLASIDENMPIWDSKVLDRIGIKSSNKRGQQKLEETIELYMFLLQHCPDVPDLHISSEEEYRLYIEVRRLANDASVNETDAEPGFKYDDKTIIMENGDIVVLKDGTKIEQISIETFMRKPRESMRVIAK